MERGNKFRVKNTNGKCIIKLKMKKLWFRKKKKESKMFFARLKFRKIKKKCKLTGKRNLIFLF